MGRDVLSVSAYIIGLIIVPNLSLCEHGPQLYGQKSVNGDQIRSLSSGEWEKTMVLSSFFSISLFLCEGQSF